MRKFLGRLVLGLAGGWVLSRLRAMPGGDLFDWPGPGAAALAGWRAAALVLVGLALWKVRGGLRWTSIVSVMIGYALHGMLAGPRQGVPWVGLPLVAIAAWIAARWVRVQAPPVSAQDGDHGTNLGEMIGLFVAGGGVALAVEGIARHVRPFGAGLAQDDTAFGIALLAFVALGAAAFGWITSSPSMRRLSFPVMMAACASACFASLALLATISDARGLLAFIKRWGLRTADHGTLGFDLLVGAASFVLPAMCVGAGLAGARGRRAIASALLGAACGLVAVSRMLDNVAGADSKQVDMSAAQLVPFAAMIAVAGACLAILSESRRRPRARYAALFLALVCAAPVLVTKTKAVPILTPWSSRLSFYATTFDSSIGLLAVRTGMTGSAVATLDGRLLTPDGTATNADDQTLRDAFDLLGAERKKAGAIQVLFVGQLDARRARLIESLGAARIDRSAAWSRSMQRLETALFKTEDGLQTLPLPTGDVLAPARARERLRHGDYDLVIAPSVGGDAPAVDGVDVPAKTVVVRWLGLEEPLRGVEIRQPVVLSADGLDAPSLGVVTHMVEPVPGDDQRLRTIEAPRWSAFVPTPLAWSLTREMNRPDRAHAATFKALASGTHPPPGPFVRGLAAHYAAQVPSSPYEHPAERVEISDTALADFAVDAQRGLDGFTRRMWEWLALVLLGKRDVDRIERFVAPLAEAHPHWAALELTLAYAALESLDAPRAVERLEALATHDPSDGKAWFALGEAREIDGDAVGATAAFKKAQALLPESPVVRRRLAMAACRAGDPIGRQLAQEILLANPKAVEMQAYVAPGSPPPAPTAYKPGD